MTSLLTARKPTQTLVIPDWVPPQVANGSHGHWSTRRKQHEQGKLMAWASAKQAGWRYVGDDAPKQRLTITLVFPVRRRRDTDNLYSRCKAICDGIKPFIVDDDTEHLELVVKAEVVPGTKQTRMMLDAC